MASNIPQQLIPPRLKIDRAKKHLSDLESVLRDHIRSDPYRLVCEYKRAPEIKSDYVDLPPPPMAYHYRIETLSPLPDEVSLVFGDVVHNLRVALDLMAYDLIVQNGGSEKFTGFPFHEEAWNLKDALEKGPISVVPKEIKDLLWSDIQPYRSGKGDSLWHMNRLDIIDKHRLLLATEHITGLANAEFVGGMNFIGGELRNRNPDGYLAISITPLVSKNEAALTFEVVIAERKHFPDRNLVETLRQLTTDTLRVVERLEEALFGAASVP